VLLRISIGWHLCYEGLTKIDPYWAALMRQPAEKENKGYADPFSAEGYLRASTGPLRHHFRNMIPDLHGLRKLDLETLKEDWNGAVNNAVLDLGLRQEQVRALNERLADLLQRAAAHVESQKAKIDVYKSDVEAWRIDDANDRYGARVDLQTRWGKLETTRRELTAPILDLQRELDAAIVLVQDAQQTTVDVTPPKTLKDFFRMSPLERANFMTKWGLAICGGLMIVGLFSRLASLGGAGLLAMFYFSLPPWPGLPPVPGTEGSYLIVNKNLVEMIACLVLATMPTGVWGGLDALVRGLVTRPLLGVGAREVVERRRLEDDDED
jgi:uncharacterized membrane protein YphA (DoxX/SURF4 family)